MKAIIPILLLAVAAPLMAGDTPVRKKNGRTLVFTQYFNLYDTNDDGILTFGEFVGSVGAGDNPVITEYRFLFMAEFLKSAGGGKGSPEGILLDTYIRYAGGLRVPKPSRAIIFEIADTNNDGFLNFDEYARTRNSGVGSPKSLNKGFNKLDKSGEGLISPQEFGVPVPI